MEKEYKGPERREFVRIKLATPLDYKVCKKETIHKLLKGYTSNISQTGILINIKEKVDKDDILWLAFDRATLGFCEELEKMAMIYQGGIIGKAVRVQPKGDGTYYVGIKFVTREEKNITYIFPKIHFEK